MKIKKRMSPEYRAAASRLKKLLGEGPALEGSLYRCDRGNAVRHQLSDRATGKFRSIYIPQDFAEATAAWSANWSAVKTALKELSEIARAELVAEITNRTGRKTVPTMKPRKPGSAGAADASLRKRRTAKRRSKS